MSHIFPFVEGDVFVDVVWDENINFGFSFDIMNSIKWCVCLSPDLW